MKNKTVLICDDDHGIVDVTTIILEEQGYDVVGITDNSQIYKIIKMHRPDVILLDLWMPGFSGEEVLTTLKKSPETRDIPVIVVSASRDTEYIANSLNADDFLCKPFDINDLSEIVKKYASRNHSSVSARTLTE